MRLVPLFISLICVISTLGQSIENFDGLRSNGIIPKDFTTLSSDKYNEDYINNLDKDLDKEFYLNTRFFLDNLLLSGKVIFNDPISVYVSKIAKYLLIDQPVLFHELRFYTIKSNMPNAFSTDQGIIFVTTGLMARVQNEAQLAFILAHEISHYTAKHVKNSYIKRKDINNGMNSSERYDSEFYNKNLQLLSKYNKNNELVADELAMNLFTKTKYEIVECKNALNLLGYLHIPFENEVFDPSCLDTKTVVIPKRFFKSNIPEIIFDDQIENSENSTHPSLLLRIELIESLIIKHKTKGANKFIISEIFFLIVEN
jgi:hypothetical protein